SKGSLDADRRAKLWEPSQQGPDVPKYKSKGYQGAIDLMAQNSIQFSRMSVVMSTRDALRAGMIDAASPASSTTAIATPSVVASVAEMPNRSDFRYFATARPATVPITVPARVNRIPSARIREKIRSGRHP